MISNSRLKMTRQRRAILEELRKDMGSHPTAEEIYEMVRRRLPRISLGTVYRNLEVLSSSGEIGKLEFGSSQRRFDGDVGDHYHVRCLQCGHVEDAPVEPLKALEDTLRELTDYDVVGHSVEFTGICPKCKTKEGSTP